MNNISEIEFLKSMLDGMASAQEQTTSPEAHYIIKPFIRAVSKRIETIENAGNHKVSSNSETEPKND